MNNTKLEFLLKEFPIKLKQLDPSAKGVWGKMNVQQMIEHMTDSVREANGKIPRTIVTNPERLPAMKDFLLSEKEFKPNTKNVLLSEEPEPIKHSSIQAAIAEFEKEMEDFQKHYKTFPDAIITNAFFGDLNYEEWIQLLHKHAVHHLKQFTS